MPETLRISIPVDVQDKTAAGIRSSQRSITAFEKVINRVQKSLEKFSGRYDVDLEADDRATARVRAAESAVEQFAGTNGMAGIGVSDNASLIVAAAMDAVEAFGGMSGSADIGANDNASSIIDSIRDKAAAWAGTAWNATVGIVDMATEPLTKLWEAAKNPVAQGAAAMGISFGLTDSLNTFREFEAQMSEVKAISGATASEMEKLTGKAKEMGATTKFTATEAGEAFSYMAMAGWKADEMYTGINGVMSLAAASGENLGTVSDIVTDALTAFGLEAWDAGHFADVLAQASSNANTNVSMLGESFKYVAPVAGAMSYSVEDVSLALGLMANASVKGSMAGTALKTSLANMASPSEKMANYMDKYGISLTNADGEMLSLLEVIDMLRSKMGGLSETEQTAAASAIFGKEAMAGMLAIINAGEDDYTKLTNAIYNSKDAAQRMSETMLDNLEGSLTLMGSAIDGLKTRFGERLAPYVQSVAEMVTAAVPGATSALDTLMDHVDGIMDGLKTRFETISMSEEFQNADLFGKVNIAWDKVIAQPFAKWAGTKGKHLLSGALGGLFEEAGKIMPGGEDAGIMSWLSAGVIAKGTTSAVSAIGKLVTAAGSIHPALGVATGAVAGLGTAIAGVSLIIDNYNQKKIDDNLAEHFGTITLTAEEAKEKALEILNMDYLGPVTEAVDSYKESLEKAKEAKDALEENDKMIWKQRISGVVWNTDEQTTFNTNITRFLEKKREEIEGKQNAVMLSASAVLTSTEGLELQGMFKEWAENDNTELTELSDHMNALVSEALKDGIISVDEQAAINELTNKIGNISLKWSKQQEQAAARVLQHEFSSLGSEGLSAESFEMLLDQLHEQRKLGEATLHESSLATIGAIWGHQDELKAAGTSAEEQEAIYWNDERNMRAVTQMNAIIPAIQALSAEYSDTLNTNKESMKKAQDEYYNNLEAFFEYGDWDVFNEKLSEGWFEGLPMDSSSVAMREMFEKQLPDIKDFQGLIDQYIEAGQTIPKELMDAYYQAIEFAAVNGDMDASWELLARKLVDPENTSKLAQAIRDGMKEIDIPREMQDALRRAQAETSAELTLEPAFELNLDKVNQDEVQRLLDEAAEIAGLKKTGESKVLDGGEIAIEYEIVEGDWLSKIARRAGVELEALKEANPQLLEKHGSWNMIDAGDIVYIPQGGRVDETALDTAAEEIKTETQDAINETMPEMDTDPAGQAVTDSVADSIENADMAPVEESVTHFRDETDRIIQEKYAGHRVPVTTTVDVQLEENIVGNDVAAKYTSRTGAGGRANGGIVTHPELSWIAEAGYPEAVIPLNGSQRAMSLWEQTGQMLGVGETYSTDASAVKAAGSPQAVSAPVTVTMNNTFQIDGSSDAESTAETVKEKLDEAMNDFVRTLGVQIEQTFSNMPMA